MRVDMRIKMLMLGEAVLTQPVSTPLTVPASSQIGLAANAHVAALVASNTGSGVGRIKLVASMFGVVVITILPMAGCYGWGSH
jgi:flagellar basal body rod protein FlgF